MTEVNLTINGRSVKADSKKTLLEAASDNGIKIPTMCYHKKLSPIGSCRMCVVEVEGVASPMTACELPVREGMSVQTESENLTRMRRMMVQLILVNHPLDCVVCERSGECELQNNAYKFGITEQPYKTEYPVRVKHSDWGFIRYNPNLCIMCERCIHVCSAEQGESFLKIENTGYTSVIGTLDGEKLDCAFCGSCISVCPVGALSSNLGLAGRSWEMTKVKSVCSHCGVGCTFQADVKKNKVMRITDDESGVNGGSLCLKGRFHFPRADQNRILSPMVRKNGRLVNVSYEEAFSEIAGVWKTIREKHGDSAIAAAGSGSMPLEDNFALRRLMRDAASSAHFIDGYTLIAGANLEEIKQIPSANSVTRLEAVLDADTVLSFSNPSHESPVTGNLIRRAVIKGASHIMITSGETTFKPDPYLTIGSPRAKMRSVLLGMARFLLDAGIIKSLTMPLSAAQEKNGPAWAEAAGVPEKLLKAAALRTFGAKRPVVLVGRDIYEGGGIEWMRILAELCEIWKAKIIVLYPQANSRGLSDMLQGSMDSQAAAAARATLDSIDNGKIRSLLVMGSNPVGEIASANGRGGKLAAALGALEQLIVIDSVMHETASKAHVVFPDTNAMERSGTFTAMDGRVQKFSRAVEPPQNIMPAWLTLQKLALSLGHAWNYKSAESIFSDMTGAGNLRKEAVR